jgi:hypothetical protein
MASRTLPSGHPAWAGLAIDVAFQRPASGGRRMAITEENRHQLYHRLEEVLGHDEATVMMEHLPPVGWADVATKRDLDAHAVATKRDLDAHAERLDGRITALEERLDGRITALEERLDGRITALEERLDGRINALEERLGGRIDTMEARFEARLERSLRMQSNRFFLGMGAMLTCLFTVQQVVAATLS